MRPGPGGIWRIGGRIAGSSPAQPCPILGAGLFRAQYPVSGAGLFRAQCPILSAILFRVQCAFSGVSLRGAGGYGQGYYQDTLFVSLVGLKKKNACRDHADQSTTIRTMRYLAGFKP